MVTAIFIEVNIQYTVEIYSCGVEIAMQAWLTVENLVHQNVLDLLWKRHLLTRSICIYMHLIYRSCRSKVSSDTKTEVYTQRFFIKASQIFIFILNSSLYFIIYVHVTIFTTGISLKINEVINIYVYNIMQNFTLYNYTESPQRV